MNYKVCGVCGLDFESFRLTKELGCPECYSAFEDELKHNGFKILEMGMTNAAPDFPMLMYSVTSREL